MLAVCVWVFKETSCEEKPVRRGSRPQSKENMRTGIHRRIGRSGSECEIAREPLAPTRRTYTPSGRSLRMAFETPSRFFHVSMFTSSARISVT